MAVRRPGRAPRWRRKLPKFRAGLKRKYGRGAKKRANRTGRRVRPRTGNSIKDVGSGGYNQWQKRKISTGKRVKQSTLDRRLVRASRNYTLLGFRGVKNFDDKGFYPIHSVKVDSINYQPLMVFALNLQTSIGLVQPALQLAFDDQVSRWKWYTVNGLSPTAASDNSLQIIRSSDPSPPKMNSTYHEYTHLKMNLWGAKAKPVKYVIDVMQPLSDEVNPWHLPVASALGTAAAQAWEEMVKQFTFNPIARIDHNIRKSFRIVKSMTVTFDPVLTVEADSDPHVKTIEWFIRRNKIVHYDKVSVNEVGDYQVFNGAELKTAVAPETNQSMSGGDKPRDKEMLFVCVRATDFMPAAAFTNDRHASFDLDFRSKFTSLN